MFFLYEKGAITSTLKTFPLWKEMCEAKKSIDQIKWGIFLRGQGNGPTPPSHPSTHTHTHLSQTHTLILSQKIDSKATLRTTKVSYPF